MNCYSLKHRFQSILFLSLVFLFISTLPLYSQETKCVVIKNFQVSKAGPFAYLGPAIKKMLDTRLAAEEIQVMDTDLPDMKSGSCFYLSGDIKSPQKGKVIIDILMTDTDKKRELNRWKISSKDLNTVLSDISRRSVEIADSIEEYEDASIMRSQGSEKKAVEAEPVIQDESLAIAKMHPDRMLYEKNIAVTPASAAIGSEGVSHSDNETLETPKSSVATEVEKEEASQEKTTLYLGSREKLPFPPPTPLETASQDRTITDHSEKTGMETVHEKASQDGAEGLTSANQNQVKPGPQGVSKGLQKQDNERAGAQDDSGWFSWLWPWGGGDESSQGTASSRQGNSSVNHQEITEPGNKESGPVDSDSSSAEDSAKSFETDGEQGAGPNGHKPLWTWN